MSTQLKSSINLCLLTDSNARQSSQTMEAVRVQSLSHDPSIEIVDLTRCSTPFSIGTSKLNDKSNKVGSIPSGSARPAGASSLSVGSSVRPHGSVAVPPLTASQIQNRPKALSSAAILQEHTFGSSIKPATSTRSNRPKTATEGYGYYIKPGTPGAFVSEKTKTVNTFKPVKPDPLSRVRDPTHNGEWPSWLIKGQPNFGLKDPSIPARAVSRPGGEDTPVERFDLDAIPITAGDYDRHEGDADKHMRELLMGAIGDAEDGMGDDAVKEGEDTIEGLAKGVRLMPHQVRGVRWMRGRESGRKYGGILADVSHGARLEALHGPIFGSQDMGLGKTIQTLARIVEGVATAAERTAGYRGGTLYVHVPQGGSHMVI